MSVDKFGRHSSGQIYTEPGVSVRYVNNNFIRRDGSNEVEGDLSMNIHKITNLSDPENHQDATNKRFVENNFVGKNSTSRTIDAENMKITNLSEPIEPEDATTRGYVKNFTRNNFLRLDGTNNMEGDLNVDNKIINLSDPTDDGDVINKSYLESTTNNFLMRDGFDSMGGDLNLSNNKIVNVANPTSAQDAVTKHYADSRKPLIEIWAQENGPLNAGEYEWSFGSGDLYTLAKCGYCMPAAGRILRGSMSSVNGANASGDARVAIVINGQVTRNFITKLDGFYSFTDSPYYPPTELGMNDRINFQTKWNTANATNNIVSLLIELDL